MKKRSRVIITLVVAALTAGSLFGFLGPRKFHKHNHSHHCHDEKAETSEAKSSADD